MVVHVLDGGTLRPPIGHAVPSQCLLVERSDGILAVDAGLSESLLMKQSGLSFERHFIRPPRNPALALVNQVRRLGFEPRDVTDIALTHLHSEHAAGMMDFPHARIHLSRSEFDTAHNGSLRSRVSYRHNIWAHGPIWELHDGNSTWLGVDGSTEIDSTTVLVPLPGHTAGHCGVAVRQNGEWILHAGDATYADLVTGSAPPKFPMRQYQWLSAADRGQVHRTHRELRRLAQHSDVRVICSHNPLGDLPIILEPQPRTRRI